MQNDVQQCGTILGLSDKCNDISLARYKSMLYYWTIREREREKERKREREREREKERKRIIPKWCDLP